MSAVAARPETSLRRSASLLFALAAGPASWVVQLVAGYALASWTCFPHDAPYRHTPPPGGERELVILVLLCLGCFVADVSGVWTCWAWLRATASKTAADIAAARTRFLARCGIMAGLGFGGAILVSAVNLVMVPACWSIPS